MEQIREGDVEAGKFGIIIAPDLYHKDNVSGGAPYSIEVPNRTIDGLLLNERNETYFVNYLRMSFKYGGFPGMQWHKGGIAKEILELANDLLPI